MSVARMTRCRPRPLHQCHRQLNRRLLELVGLLAPTSDQSSTSSSASLPTQALPFLEPAASMFTPPPVDPADYRLSEASMSSLSKTAMPTTSTSRTWGSSTGQSVLPDMAPLRSVADRPPSLFRDVGTQCCITRAVIDATATTVVRIKPHTISMGSDARPMPGRPSHRHRWTWQNWQLGRWSF